MFTQKQAYDMINAVIAKCETTQEKFDMLYKLTGQCKKAKFSTEDDYFDIRFRIRVAHETH